ncbi:hypothetical protein K7640_21315 [Micromonospora sp. PLK6-60]|uniref:hypothetical protein n=1 Tax=Micromonospora sp. PLK6-60 TaxID=2873383 RepID=UPI001CA73F14|nr:hypothetical protein [Micromonospora sp. PLK6-60]MBY8874374.1 hypothetical protein [Micromonospora sp. PLK6-60]
MGRKWRIAVGALAGVTGAVTWALAAAIYQPFMQPDGFWTDSATGATLPELASNNTYWPRDIRQLAILLALGGVLLICRSDPRGLAVGGVATVGWLGADLWLDRIDVAGGTTAAWLAAGGLAVFAATAVLAHRASAGADGSPLAGHVTATVAALLSVTTMLVSTPWDEPVTAPDQVAVENALAVLKAALVVMFVVTALALVVRTTAQVRRVAVFVGVAALGAWLAVGGDGGANPLGMAAMFVGATLAVAAARDVPPTRLLPVAIVSGAALLPAFAALYLIGMGVGSAMTVVAGNPPVNGADSDLALTFCGLALGLLLASLSHLLTRAAPARPHAEPTPVPNGG